MKKILFAAMCAFALVFMTGCSKEAELEELAVSVVDDIMEENLRPFMGDKPITKCTKVDLTEKVGDNKWTGKAYFDNGREIDCVVIDADDEIIVEIDFETFK